MVQYVRIIKPDDPEFKKLMAAGKITSGADVEIEMAKIKGEDYPGPDDEVVQPKSK